MSDTQAGSTRRATPTAWVGVVVFGGVMLMLAGGLQIMQGFIAILRNDFYHVTNEGLLVTLDYTGWGCVHLALGLIAVVTSIGVLAGRMWARVTGVVLAVISAVVNLAFLPAYPIWSTTLIVTDVLVIYALTVHGSEVRNDR
jgi:hypothetical protein